MAHDTPAAQRLIIVSNRLPFTAIDEGDRLRFRESAGGLVSGLSAYLESVKDTGNEYVWVGWPGNTIGDSLKQPLIKKAREEFHSYPVFLTEEEMELFYHGFCNETIWPLFHYFPSYTSYQLEFWEHYKRVNRIFADALLEVVNDDDIVWVHDYHLMLLPKLLREKKPQVAIGFFLHIPFPSFEVFRLLPGKWRRQILEGMIGADLIGFHAYDYSHHFFQCLLRILGHDHNMGQISLKDRVVRVETFPLGINYGAINRTINDPGLIPEKERLRKTFSDVRVILSVDRLDYSKGILNRLQGFEILLEGNTQYRQKVVLVMIVVPSRVAVKQYELMKRQIEELVGKINGKFGTISWTPVIYQYRSLSFEPLMAMYSISDIALVTPLRDGMNLVSKEYVATRVDETGVLILSEMAGAAKELGEGIIINPNNREEISEALKEALEMPLEEQRRRMRVMRNRLKRYDVVRWATEFVDRLVTMKQVQERFVAKVLSAAAKHGLQEEYRNAQKRLIFLDYDGTLVPLMRLPHEAHPTEQILTILSSLTSDQRNDVVIISGRDRSTLDEWLGSLSVNFVAEHGIWMREGNDGWKMLKQQSSEWKPHIMPILQLYADRLPGSFVEEKDFSLVWHYRAADPEQARLLVGELTDHLVNFTANIDLQVLQGSKIIEVRTTGVNKGIAGTRWMAREQYDFILAIGDDWTDEDLFMVLPESTYTIRVGVTNTHARYNLKETSEVIDLLDSLTHVDQPA